MKFTIELRRIGTSRVSEETIPLVARIFTHPLIGYGRDLLANDRLTDIECAKATIQSRLNQKFGLPVTIEWIDATHEGE